MPPSRRLYREGYRYVVSVRVKVRVRVWFGFGLGLGSGLGLELRLGCGLGHTRAAESQTDARRSIALARALQQLCHAPAPTLASLPLPLRPYMLNPLSLALSLCVALTLYSSTLSLFP